MADQEEGSAVLEFWEDHREQMRQSENQRAVLTNYVLLIAIAISGFVVHQQFSLRNVPLSVLTLAIGLYGAVSAAKYHERADCNLSRARALTRALVRLCVLPDTGAALEDARQTHLGIAVYGAGLLIITCVVQ